MIGAVIFVIAFVLFLLISFVTPLPPGATVIEGFVPELMGSNYEGLVSGIINGVIYGIIIWIVFSIAMMFYNKTKGPKEVLVKVEAQDAK
ncbi:MAG: hypothetical protein NWF06_06620 [Candidatus Bathyarchaeota archaeon]|nr:hypothetical protein [Candidatus Bathyarchaeum sp.]